MLKNIYKVLIFILMGLTFTHSFAGNCEKRRVNCLSGPSFCESCSIGLPVGCTTSGQAANLKYYIYCEPCRKGCTLQIEGGTETDFVACGNSNYPQEFTNPENALYFELDFSDNNDVLDNLAKVHPEQAMRLLMFETGQYDKNDLTTDLRQTSFTSSVLPSYEFFKSAFSGDLEEKHVERGSSYVEQVTTRLDNGTILLVESWASLLPNEMIEIRIRSVIADIVLPENDYIPTKVLAETVTFLEPIKNEEDLFKISSIEW